MTNQTATQSSHRPLVLLVLLVLALALTLGFVPHATEKSAATVAVAAPKATPAPASPTPVQVQVRMEPPPQPAPAASPAPVASAEESPMGDAGRLAALARLEGTLELPFADYLAAIERAGGRLVLFDEARDQLLGWHRAGTWEPNVDLTGFSPRARDLTNEVPSSQRRAWFAEARAMGAGVPRLLVIWPEALEANFLARVDAALRSRGLRLQEQDRVHVRYRLVGTRLVALIDHAEADGQKVPIQLEIPVTGG